MGIKEDKDNNQNKASQELIPPATNATDSTLSGAFPEPWLYTTIQMVLMWVPDEPPFQVPAFYGPDEELYYRVTPELFAYLFRLILTIEHKWLENPKTKVPWDQIIAGYETIRTFGRLKFSDTDWLAPLKSGATATLPSPVMGRLKYHGISIAMDAERIAAEHSRQWLESWGKSDPPNASKTKAQKNGKK